MGTILLDRKPLRSLDWNKTIKWTSILSTQWKFNPPTAVWWERVVPMVKRLLRTVFRRASLKYEMLMAILCNDEPAINSSNLIWVLKIPRTSHNSPQPCSLKTFRQSVFQTWTIWVKLISPTISSSTSRNRSRWFYPSLTQKTKIGWTGQRRTRCSHLPCRWQWHQGEVRTAIWEVTRPVQWVFPLQMSQDNPILICHEES